MRYMLFSSTRAKATLQKLAQGLLQRVRGKKLTEDELISSATELAEYLLEASLQEISREEKKVTKILQLLVKHPDDKRWAFTFIDTLFRPKTPEKFLLLLQDLIQEHGFPSFLTKFQQTLIALLLKCSKLAPQFMASLLREITRLYLINKTGPVICTTPRQSIKGLVRRLKRKKFLVNLNHLGEAIVSEQEAAMRLETYLHDIKAYPLDMVSIKLSSIYSQIANAAFETTISTLKTRLESLLEAALQQPQAPWIMLDMEEWKDLEMTVALVKQTLQNPRFKKAKLGLALQAYIPTSTSLLETLLLFSKERVAQAGHPIRIRIVKGANLLMEQFEARIKCWPQATYNEKIQTDANFKYMIDIALAGVKDGTLELGIGSHNLFDISYAAIQASSLDVLQKVNFETLAGMAPYCSRTLAQFFPNKVALYCPTVEAPQFFSTLAYLLRRLDENTGPENFLTTLLELEDPTTIQQTGTWKQEISRFCQAVISRESCPKVPLRTQNRKIQTSQGITTQFINSQDSDFSLACNRDWLQTTLESWKTKPARQIPIQVGGEYIFGTLFGKRFDPSRPGYLIHEHHLATQSELQQALSFAPLGAEFLVKKSPKTKAALFFTLADMFEEARGQLLGAIVQEVAKNPVEADQEISEAVDFLRYYADTLNKQSVFSLTTPPEGIALIASPWNFPCSIPVNAIVSALALNKAVLFKPSPEAVGVAWEIVQLFWKGGIPHTALQFIPTKEDPEGYFLLHQPSIDTLFLTGATQTARLFMQQFPKRTLIAETGGKNAIIVTESADLDLAIQGIMTSAFGYSGQKCSACSRLLVEEALYYGTDFLHRLRDAAASLVVGPAWDPLAKITPLAKGSSSAFNQARANLEGDESWLLEPRQSHDNPALFSPGIKVGVSPDSFTFKNELFGPLLAVTPIKNFSQGIEFANSTMYGLTAGLYSLNPREKEQFCSQIEAGNIYVNRPCTGAIVGRQPFGGVKASSFGMGMKAGGPSYLLQLFPPTNQSTSLAQEMITKSLLQLTSLLLPKEENIPLVAIARDYATIYAIQYKQQRDLTSIQGQHNYLEYRPLKELFLVLHQEDSFSDIWPIFAAAALLEIDLKVGGANLPIGTHTQTNNIASFCSCIGWKFYHSLDGFMEAFADAKFPKLRAISTPSEQLLAKLSHHAYSIDIRRPSRSGQVELLRFLQEISFSIDYHRFGNCFGSSSSEQGSSNSY